MPKTPCYRCWQVANTRHDGSLSTAHANSAGDLLFRIETMVLMGMEIPLAAIRQQMASAVDIIVHLTRYADGTRRVVQVCEVDGVENGNVRLRTLYRFDGKEYRKEEELCHVEKETQYGEKTGT